MQFANFVLPRMLFLFTVSVAGAFGTPAIFELPHLHNQLQGAGDGIKIILQVSVMRFMDDEF
ncbi:hypothetical protein ACJEMS_23955, partial [Escherichia coli]